MYELTSPKEWTLPCMGMVFGLGNDPLQFIDVLKKINFEIIKIKRIC